MFVRCTCADKNQQLDVFFYSSKCGIHFTRTVIAQGFEAHVSTGREVESAWVQIFLHTVLNTVNTYII